MLFQLIRSISGGGNLKESIIMVLMCIPVVLIALSLHELSHGLAAYALGDDTAKKMGRLSINPLRHLDPIGAIMLFVFGFGWAKPVPVNVQNFKNRKGGMALTALAGPFANFILSFIGYFLSALCLKQLFVSDSELMYALYLFFYVFYSLNLGLAIFNLIPIPPLDGSRILMVILPERLYFKFMRYERYIVLIVLLALFTGILDVPLSIAMNAVENLFAWIVGAIL